MMNDISKSIVFDPREGICHHCDKPLDYDPFDGSWIPRKKDGTLSRIYSQNFDRVKRIQHMKDFYKEWDEQTNP